MATYYLIKIKLDSVQFSHTTHRNYSAIFQEDAKEHKDLFLLTQHDSLERIGKIVEKVWKKNLGLARATYVLLQVDISNLDKGVLLGQEECQVLEKEKKIVLEFGTKFKKGKYLFPTIINPCCCIRLKPLFF